MLVMNHFAPYFAVVELGGVTRSDVTLVGLATAWADGHKIIIKARGGEVHVGRVVGIHMESGYRKGTKPRHVNVTLVNDDDQTTEVYVFLPTS